MRLLVIQVAGLGKDLVESNLDLFASFPFSFHAATPSFPAVTCTAQATFRTGLDSGAHGMIANGVFSRKLTKTEFWNQSAALVEGERLWERARRDGKKVGMMFWQQSLGECADLILSPAPIHKHGGGMIQDCYSRPSALYPQLLKKLGRGFNLMHYWGPLASRKSSDWITAATTAVLEDSNLGMELLFTYLPHLDYVLQRRGPESTPHLRKNIAELVDFLNCMCEAAAKNGYDVLVWGDYAIAPARRVVYPNHLLRQAGLFYDRSVGGRSYPDLYSSPAFALVDHQVAHVYVRDRNDIARVHELFFSVDGVDRVIAAPADAHENSGELILTAEPDAWFAYHWWEVGGGAMKPPDYATHVDIHNKIGFDPCELFFGRLIPPGTTLDCSRIRGTHGRADLPVAYAGSMVERFAESPAAISDLARLTIDMFTNA